MFYFLLSIVFFLQVSCGDWSTEFEFNEYLDNNNQYRLFWTKLNDSYMEFGIECVSNGWVGFGISSNGFMTNSDIAFAWIGDDGTTYLQDRYVGDDHVTPQLDSSQDLILLEGYKINNVTSIRFIRAINPCDDNDLEIVDGTSRVIYAWNDDNIPDVLYFDSTVNWHGINRGSVSLNLLSPTTFINDLEDDVQTFDIIMNNYTIPSDKTTYYCKLIELPKFNQTNHIVKFAPILTAGNEDTVHHMLVYYCPSSMAIEDVGTEDVCLNYQASSLSSAQCIFGTVVFAWAVGADEFSLPSEVGYQLSGSSDLQYVILEIHYNNEYQLSNVKDSSGIRIYYTPTLRPNNASTLDVGIMVAGYSQILPPGASSLVNYAYCHSSCTNAGIPENGTKIFASFLHEHTHGIALSLKQIRNGVELKAIESNWNYDFDYQATTAHLEPILLLPNDSLILECYYQTIDTNHTVFSGLSTSDEMCMVFLYVYPAITLDKCYSSHVYSDVEKWAEIANQQGYLTNFDTYYYNLSVDGAMEWYEMLWNNYTNRSIECTANDESLISSYQPFLSKNQYIPYNDSTPCIQISDLDKENIGNNQNVLQLVVFAVSIISAIQQML